MGGRAGSRKGKKGADKGIDGIINFFEQDDKGKARARRVIAQVKSGKVSVKDIRELKSAVDSEKAAIGLFITLELPTQQMVKEALEAGFYESAFWQRRYRRLQIVTVSDLLGGASPPDMPPMHGTHQKAERYSPTSMDSAGKSQQGLL
ncbi:MAG: restriction endonuclease [Chloroflexi bacterium]|nr:restriction endonuclease [Chloroflexota bacterium]